MKIKVITGDIARSPADAVVVTVFEGQPHLEGITARVDTLLNGVISKMLAGGEIEGKAGQTSVVHTLGAMPTPRVAVVGLGKQAALQADGVRRATAEACRCLRAAGARKIATVLFGGNSLEPLAAAQAMAEGALLGLYSFKKYRQPSPRETVVDELQIVLESSRTLSAVEKGSQEGVIVSECVNLARNMVNEPSNRMTPTEMAETARDLAAKHGLEVTVLDREQIRRAGMGALLAVAQGSHHPPKFIVLQYKGNPGSQSTLGLVGKGVTFDSGGISIKPSEGMEEMKDDMSGGAIVMSAISAISQLKLKINVTAICAATENLPGGSAFKPGDVLRAMNGKSIEVISTDAEGRLTLADALSYANKHHLSPLVDVATLTGACRIALGMVATGLFSNNQELADKVLKAAGQAGEKMWQMPMFEEYKEQNKSDIADIKNTGGRYGGAITAAQFLAEFAGDTPWVHLDIAGTTYTDKVAGYNVKGATGVAVRTLINLAREMAGQTA